MDCKLRERLDQRFTRLPVLVQRLLSCRWIWIDGSRAMRSLSERCRQAVVVLLLQWIVLVVMAADATQGQSEHRPAHGHQHIIQLIVANSFDCLGSRLARVRACDQKTAGGRGKVIIRQQLVAGQLHPHELVVRQIVVERANHPVAVVIRSGAKTIKFVTTAFSKPRDIEPMASPFFTVVRTFQQSVNHGFEGMRRRVVHKRVDLLRRWRQTDKIEICASNQLFFRRLTAWCQPMLGLR